MTRTRDYTNIFERNIIFSIKMLAYKLNQEYGADTPIIDAVYQILYENKEAKAVFKKLTDQLN